VDDLLHRAQVHSLLISAAPAIDLSFSYRNLDPAYRSMRADAFTENSRPVNEYGFYAGITLRPAAGWQVNAYADRFVFPWLRYRVNAPTTGFDQLFEVKYRPDKKSEYAFRFHVRNKPINEGEEFPVQAPEDQVKHQLRIQYHTELSPQLISRSRLECLWLSMKTQLMRRDF
jgi:hypothetical protein